MRADADRMLRPNRLGAGVFLDAQALWALRAADHPEHQRVKGRILDLAAGGLPLCLSYLSLAEAARLAHVAGGAAAARELIAEAREAFNLLVPSEDDLRQAEAALAGGIERLTLEQAVAGALAKRLGCSIYGFSPAYHLLRLPVVMD